MRDRVAEYYRTSLGAQKPHAGGNWIQTLEPEVRDASWVHLAELRVGEPDQLKKRVENAEEAALVRFLADGDGLRQEGHPEPSLFLPFANLQVIRAGRKTKREHAIKWRRPNPRRLDEDS